MDVGAFGFLGCRGVVVALVCACSSAGCSGRDRPPPFGVESSSSAPLPDSADGRLRGGPCPVTIERPREASCGTLTVPEDRSANPSSSATIELPVIVYKGKIEGAVPVVYLEGGPGVSAIDTVTSVIELFDPLLREHDLIIFDQRGTGLADPELSCPELGNDPTLVNLAPDEFQTELATLRACRTRFSEAGMNVANYNSRSNAADVDDLRRALGHEKWHLFGVSYGTRLALDVMRYHSDGVLSAVIDSVLPVQANYPTEGAMNVERTFNEIFAACEAQTYCASAYPNLRNVLFELVDQLDETPANVTSPSGGSLEVSGEDVLQLIFLLAYSAEAISYIPEIIFQFAAGGFQVFEAFSEALAEGGISVGMYLSIVCSEYVAFSSLAALDMANMGVTARLIEAFGSPRIFDVCAAWDVPAADPAERQPAQSDLPTLVLAGRFDPVTPPSWAALAASTLTSAQLLTFQDQSHGVFTAPCAGDLLNAFYRNPRMFSASACSPTDRLLEFYVPSERLSAGAALSSPGAGPVVGDLPEQLVRQIRHWIR